MSKDTLKAPGRRRFFKELAVAGGATALLAVGGRTTASEAQSDTPDGSKGYRLSEHVKAYYRSLRI